MNTIKNELEKRIKELESIIKKAEKDIAMAEEGVIRICHRGGKEMYYLQSGEHGKTNTGTADG